MAPGPAPVTAPPVFVAPQAKGNGAALAAVLLGAAGLALLVLSLGFLVPLSLPCSIAATVCGVIGRRRARDGRARGGRGQATAGLALGIIGVALGVLVLALAVALIAADGMDMLEDVPRPPGERSA